MSLRRIAVTVSLLGALVAPATAALAADQPTAQILATDEGTEENRGGPVATIPLVGDADEIRIREVTVTPGRIAPGDRIVIRGEMSGAAPGTEIFVFIGGLPTGAPLVIDEDGQFVANIETPAALANGPADVSIGLGDGTTYSVDIVTVAVSTGIDLTDQIPSADDDTDDDAVAEDALPATPDEGEPADDAGGETLADDRGAEATAVPETGLTSTLLSYLPWIGAVVLAGAALLGIMAITRRRSHRNVTGADRFDMINEPAAAGPVAEDGSLDTWVGETRTAGERGAPHGTTIAEALSTIEPPNRRELSTEYSVIEMTERIRSDRTEEKELAADLTMDHAQRVAREARDHHAPASNEIETWWIIRRGRDGATVWIAHSWSEREYHVDPETGEMESGTGGGRVTGVA